MSGSLYLVATPIGNYDDITYRALNVLRSADIVVYEERREGERLMRHFQIEKPVESLNEHNEAAPSFHILSHLKAGKSVALVSDCGTPVFSDPGQTLVHKAIQANIRIIAATAKKLDLPMERVVLTIADHGNTSGGSIPLALDTAITSGDIKPGEILLLEAFGAGFTWGSALIRY